MIYIKKSRPSRVIIDKVNEIKRSQEWRNVSADNAKAVREQFELLPKEEIRDCLLKEQRYLCAYCMKRIENNGLNMTIEHWYPLSKDKERALDYSNMLGVCNGGRNTDLSEGEQRYICCDAHKGDEEEMTLNPADQQQMNQIMYRTNGEIYTEPRDERMEKDINYTLRLNGVLDKNGNRIADTSTQILKGRREAYEQCRVLFSRLNQAGKCNSNTIKKRIDEMESQEKMPEYSGIILFFLKKKYKELVRRGI